MLERIVLLVGLLAPTPLLAMDVTDVQGGCEPSLAHKLVRQASGKLERCGATGQVMVHVAPDGRVEGVDADADAKPCLTGRMAQWRLKMREARHCATATATGP